MLKIDFSKITGAQFSDIFGTANDCKVEICDEGVKFTGTKESRDPWVLINFKNLKQLCNLDDADKFPEDTSEVKACVLKIKANLNATFNIYYTCGDVYAPTDYYDCEDNYYGTGDWEYCVGNFSFKGDMNWCGKINETFRLDWSNSSKEGDECILNEMLLFDSAKDAIAYEKKMNSDRNLSRAFVPEDCIEPQIPEKADKKGYYVCLHERRLNSKKEEILGIFENIEDAKKLCEENKVLGYRVCDENGKLCYLPYKLLECNLLREGKFITDYARTHGFTYGDAPVNPAIDHEAKKVSCDRLVCWMLYRVGFVLQPRVQGVVVTAFPEWCEKNNFTEIHDFEHLRPGDVMLVRPSRTGLPLHAFAFADYSEKPEVEFIAPAQVADPEAPPGQPCDLNTYSYRYDCGSDVRIQSVQPTNQKLFYDAYVPVHVYRPVVSKENNIFWEYYENN